MSKLKLIGLGFAALGTIGAGVVGSLGYKKLKMQDEAIDRMVSTLEDANDMLIKYEDKVKKKTTSPCVMGIGKEQNLVK